MSREHTRESGHGYHMEITQINGQKNEDMSGKTITVDDISNGGFRFRADAIFELEDRLQVRLEFPDRTICDVFGRICYCVMPESDNGEVEPEMSAARAYGLSILSGFYEL